MRSNASPEGDGPGSRRSSASSRFRASGSALPRLQNSTRESRASLRVSQSNNNPFIHAGADTGRPSSHQSYGVESVRPGSRESSKENMAPPDADEYEKYRKEIESLKAEIATLKYRTQTVEQEKEIALSQQANKVEQARRREQDEAQQKQAAEAAQAKMASQVDAIRQEMADLKNTAEENKKALERAAREAQGQVQLLQEQLEDMTSAKEETARLAERKANDLKAQITASLNSLLEAQQESQAREEMLQQTQSQVAEKDAQIAHLEADVLRLKAQGGDAETMGAIRNELSEQVHHIRSLEATNRDQLTELKHLRAVNKAVEVVEEEKRSLQRKLDASLEVEAELAEARIQRQRLEDERLAWTAYLKHSSETGDNEFDSPEAIARALVEERLTTASYVEKIGALHGEIAALQNTIETLEHDKAQFRYQLEDAKTSANAITADKARLRLDRQRALAVKEVEYLRAQLKTFDVEDQTIQPDQYDEARAARVQQLEELVDNYKAEVQGLHAELSSLAASSNGTPQSNAGTKRPRPTEDDVDEQLGQLARKNRKLQDEASHYQTQIALLEKDLSACREQLTAAKEQTKTRVLSLRSNPTADHEAIKRSTLEALQKENKDLLATLRSKATGTSIPLIPTSVLAAMEGEIAAAKAETASAEKSARRLKEVWGSKSQEFKEAIFSTLGWTVTFIPNGKMRVESTFYPSQTDEHENSIVFDGERGTMKVGGGPKSPFARRISDQIGFWVRDKGCIPGFLAALTLEFYEEHTKASRS